MPPTPLPRHRVPPGLLMFVTRDEVLELATWNDHVHRERGAAHAAMAMGAEAVGDAVDLRRRMAVLQWRFNQATAEAMCDAEGEPDSVYAEVLSWHFGPDDRRACPDGGRCTHECGPVAGCWRVACCGPLSLYGESWALADRIAHERPGGSL